MSNVASICKSSKQRGNALVLLILLKTWEGSELLTREDLADLAHICPRQAERDLLKLVEDGEIEKVGRRGQVTRFRVKGLTHLSDESDKHQTNTADEVRADVSDLALARTDLTVESVTYDLPLSDTSDTSVRPLDGTPIAPFKVLRTSTDNKKDSLSSRATQAEPKRERVTKFSREVREAYATAKSLNDGWLHTSRDGRYDEVIERWQASEGSAETATRPPTPSLELTPDELQTQANVVAGMLEEGRTLPEIHAQIGVAIRPAQWAQIASIAKSQVKPPKRDTATESPPPAPANLINFTGGMRAQKG